MSYIIFSCSCKFRYSGDQDIHLNVGDSLPLGIDIDIYNDEDINEDCPLVWRMLAAGLTRGCFQLESYLGKKWAEEIKPDSIEELGDLIALIRPGCLQAKSGNPPKSMTERYADRKHGIEEVKYIHPSLKSILKVTYGVLVTQEQSMKIAQKLAGFNLQQADVLRKAIGKKKADVMEEVEQEFMEGCKKTKIVNEKLAKEIFGWIRKSQKYSFNSSHGISYGKNLYWSAYMKAHFPLQFFCSYINGANNKGDKKYNEIRDMVYEAKLFNVEVCVPKFKNLNYVTFIKEGKIYFGLQEIRDIGESGRNRILRVLREKEGEIENLTWSSYLFNFSDHFSSKINNAFINVGCLDYMGESRNRMLYEYDLFNKLTKKESAWIIENCYGKTLIDSLKLCMPTKKEGGGCHNQKRSSFVKGLISALKNPPYNLTDNIPFLAEEEKKYLGVSISCNEVDGYEGMINVSASCKEILSGKPGLNVVGVEIFEVKQIFTKKDKKPMSFLTIADHSGIIDGVVCFPKQHKLHKDEIFEKNKILLAIYREKKGLIVRNISRLKR